MKVLTVRQPWAWAIAEGYKTVENRTWSTSYRGPILIHAGTSSASMREGRAYLERLRIEAPPAEDLTYGAVVARVELVDCLPLADVDRIRHPFAEGPFCWRLDDVVAVEPVAMTGRLGLFTVDDVIAVSLLPRQPGPRRSRSLFDPA